MELSRSESQVSGTQWSWMKTSYMYMKLLPTQSLKQRQLLDVNHIATNLKKKTAKD